MKRVSIASAKRNLYELLGAVRQGETVLIVEDGRPVARLAPCLPRADETLASLAADGIIEPPERELDLKAFLAMPRARLPEGTSAVRAVLDDRREER